MTVDELLEDIITLGKSIELYKQVMTAREQGKDMETVNGIIEDYCINRLSGSDKSVAYAAGYVNGTKVWISYINKTILKGKKWIKFESRPVMKTYFYACFITEMEITGQLEDYMEDARFKEGFKQGISDFIEGIQVKE